MAMYDDERAAYVLQFFLSNGKTVTIRGTGKDIPNEGDVILDLHSFTVFESDSRSPLV
jgi:hypothetical protein